MYKVLYIDEENAEIENFQEYIELFDVQKNFELSTLKPLPEIEESIEEIIKTGPDVIVCDYLINENIGELGYVVPYNGIELVEAYLKIRPKFPCFVLTAKDGDAVKASQDVNLVYGKSLMVSDKEKNDQNAKFTDRLIQQIQHYKHKIEAWSSEFDSLVILKYKGDATAKDEERLNELDELLEKSIDNRAVTPKTLKEPANLQKLDELLFKVDNVIKKLS